jgi:MoaA/NifB/PqqE/SkfB family radical SAM enzyme
MRASPHAFAQMASRLKGLRSSGIPFGFIFTLTQQNVHELQWVADFAAEQGARCCNSTRWRRSVAHAISWPVTGPTNSSRPTPS